MPSSCRVRSSPQSSPSVKHHGMKRKTKGRSRSSSSTNTYSDCDEKEDRPMWGADDVDEERRKNDDDDTVEVESTSRKYRGKFRWDGGAKRSRRSSSEDDEEEEEEEEKENRRKKRRSSSKKTRKESPDKKKKKKKEEKANVEQKLIECNQCDVKKLTLKGIVHHQLNQHGLGIECTFCHKKFNSNESWKAHCEEDHPEKRVQCIYCKSLFELPAEMSSKRWDFIYKHIYAELLYARLAEHEDGLG